MKKLLAIVVLGLLWSGNAYAEKLPTKLFGIEIYGNIEDHAKKDSGKKYPNRKGIISFNESEYKFINIKRNNNLDKYFLRSDEKFKILVITGSKKFKITSKDDISSCRNTKNEFVDIISNLYKVNQNSFKQKYYKYNYKSNNLLIDASEISYRKKFNKLILQIQCSYIPRKDKPSSSLFITLMDANYFEDYTLKLWEEIDKFDEKKIFIDLTGF